MKSLDKIGEVVPQINGFCSSSSPNKIMRYIQFKVVNPRSYWLLSQQADALKKDKDGSYSLSNIDYMPDKDKSCCTQNFPITFGSDQPFTFEIDWADGNVETLESVETTSSNLKRFVVQFRLYNTPYYDGNGKSTYYSYRLKKDGSNYIPHEPYVFKDGLKKSRIVTFNVIKGTVKYFYAYHINFETYPLFSIPEMEYLWTSECTSDNMPYDTFKYLNNLTTLGIGYTCKNKLTKVPDSIWTMKKLTQLQLSSTLSNTDPETNGLKNIKNLTNLVDADLHNCTKYYIPEFNELTKLKSLKISKDTVVDDEIFTKYNIGSTETPMQLYNLQIGFNWNGGNKYWQDPDKGWNYPYAELSDATLSRIMELHGFGGSMNSNNAPFRTWNKMTNLRTIYLSQQWPLYQYGSTSSTNVNDTIKKARVPIDEIVKNLFINVVDNNIEMLTNNIGSFKSQWRGINLLLYRSQQYNSRQMRPSGEYKAPDGFELGKSNGLTVDIQKTSLTPEDIKLGKSDIDFASCKVLRKDGSLATPMEMLYCLVNNYSWKIYVNGDATGLEENNAGAYPTNELSEETNTTDYTMKCFVYLDVTDKNNPIMIGYDNYGFTDILGMDNIYIQGFTDKTEAKELCSVQNIEWNDTEL